MTTCCIGGCKAEILGLSDGWDAPDRDGVACSDCRDYQSRHGHWPDEEPESCVECLVDDGAVRHECDEAVVDAVILEPGTECDHCGAEIETTETPTHD